MNFTFTKSFQEVVTESNTTCTCGAVGRNGFPPPPQFHSDSCPTGVLFQLWKNAATNKYASIRHIPSSLEKGEASFD